MATSPLVAAYLADLDRALAGAEPADRLEIVDAVREHIDAELGASPTQAEIAAVLRRLGTADDVAAAWAVGADRPATAPGAGSNAPAEPPRISPGAAAIEIATTAPHAVAYVDGAPIREAPCVLEVEPGEHVVAVYAAGMVPAEAVVRVAAAQRQRVELTPSTPRRRIDVPAQ